jgi:hypothetical protein
LKQQTKAALLSGLIFPGLGQLAILKRQKRGLAMLLPALASFGWLMYGLVKATSPLMDEALRGTLSPDPAVIAARLTETSAITGAGTASWILLACWLASLVDALAIKD